MELVDERNGKRSKNIPIQRKNAHRMKADVWKRLNYINDIEEKNVREKEAIIDQRPRLWCFELDSVCIAETIHYLIFAKPMELRQIKIPKKDDLLPLTHGLEKVQKSPQIFQQTNPSQNNSQTSNGYCVYIGETIKRYWHEQLWRTIFMHLLNPRFWHSNEYGIKQPDLIGLRNLIETELQTNPVEMGTLIQILECLSVQTQRKLLYSKEMEVNNNEQNRKRIRWNQQ
ncbi:MAG: hypothetical protein EZS28_008978 [Streblomastix strix]|uniref:Uncharacterized protein n=1 Tax=Streblomastix strix TaxID=222440 RepID=A0A5J4WKG2_9EUKA|nr:MAG: hypothetical protein EZS28_008978 [Streblomastix strix]